MQVPDVEVTLAEGRSIQLDELWQGAPVALVFLRHFG
jgi:hypothetical protein